jgi:hypothetical protein
VIRYSTPTFRARRNPTRAALLLGALVSLLFAADAQAAVEWDVASVSKTTVAPGGKVTYYQKIGNVGDTKSEGEEKFTVTLPPGMSGVSLEHSAQMSCSDPAGATSITCTSTKVVRGGDRFPPLKLVAQVDPTTPEGLLITAIDLEGGGDPIVEHTVDPIEVAATEPGFGIDNFDSQLTTGVDPYTQAAGHPELQTTELDLNSHADPNPIYGEPWPFEDLRDAVVSLPPGLVGNPAAFSQCTPPQLMNGEIEIQPLCPLESQVGSVLVRAGGSAFFQIPVYNMVPPPSVPARFGFNVTGSLVVLDAHVRSSGDYGIDVTAKLVPQAVSIIGNSISLWGVPGGPSHNFERLCPGAHYLGSPFDPNTCAGARPPTAFFRAATACASAGEMTTGLRVDSWQHPGVFAESSAAPHDAPGFPYPREDWGAPVGNDGCGKVPFEPTLKASPTTDRADSPTGLSVDIGLPARCWEPMGTEAEVESTLCQSDMKDAKVTLPEGMTLNPAAASGREGCSPQQVGLTTGIGSMPVHFDEAPVSCPDASKIGTVEIETPLLGKHYEEGGKAGEPVLDAEGHPVLEPLRGSVYLARQGDNPFGSLLAFYLVAEGSGVVVKQAGQVSLEPSTGRVTTSFTEVPQTPFSKIHVELFGGQRAALRTPAGCGTYAVEAVLTPWSGNAAAQRQSPFQIGQDCSGRFDPKLQAGTQNPLAGKTSPFNLRITRGDGSQELAGLSVSLPPGLTGYLKGISYCTDSALAAVSDALGTGAAQEASPSCPPNSQVGIARVGAGAGTNPFYTSSGRAYLAGPYKGAPVSLAVVAPAVAGPFDLGSVVVRNAIHVDPASAQLTIDSDPLPTVLHGIPLDLRDVQVSVNRDHFTLNPTNCNPLAVVARIASRQGATASRSVRFQANGCDKLGFKPRLSLRLKGGTKRAKHPALTAVLWPRLGNANAARVQVALPHSEFLAQGHIGTICTRVQFAAGNCPKGSVYGKVTATSPIIDYPLYGKIYLRSSNHLLPDMVLALHGPPSQPIEVDTAGRIDSKGDGIRTTFATIPDVPLTKVVLHFPGGKKSLLENSTDICRGRHRADVDMRAQNGKTYEAKVKLVAKCGKAPHKRQKG